MTSVWDNVARCTACDMENGCVCPVIEMSPCVSDNDSDNQMDTMERQEKEHIARRELAMGVDYAGWLEEWIDDECCDGPLDGDYDLAVSAVNDALNEVACNYVDCKYGNDTLPTQEDIDAEIDRGQHTTQSRLLITNMRNTYIEEHS